MTASSALAYDPSDPYQSAFLSALGTGETGGPGHYATGFGGADLSGAATDASGFPVWGGGSTSAGPTHAAGEYQFQPSTWSGVAQAHGLNFQNPADQDAGAWYVAQDAYSAATGGGSLEHALQTGDYVSIQNALGGTWPSVAGNAAEPQGLAATLNGTLAGGGLPSADNSPGSASLATGAPPAPATASGSGIGNWLTRGGLVVVGVILAGIALVYLLRPTPIGQAVANAGKGLQRTAEGAAAALA